MSSRKSAKRAKPNFSPQRKRAWDKLMAELEADRKAGKAPPKFDALNQGESDDDE